MTNYKKNAWLWNYIVVFALILNVILIKMAFTGNADLYWLLIATIPLLSFGMYIFFETNRAGRKYNFDTRHFDVFKNKFKWLPPSAFDNAEEIDLGILIGNSQCKQPYTATIFNIESVRGMQNENSVFYSLKKRKINNLKSPEEDVLSTYFFGEGLVWQIRPAYTGCRFNNGHFNYETFKKNAGLPKIKMIELILPSFNKFKSPFNSANDIAETFVPKSNNSFFQEAGYSTFTEAEGMIHFLDSLRNLSEGKPIGIRLCIDDKHAFYQICYAIQKTQFFPDFIVVEGAVTKKGSTGLAQSDYSQMPLYEALLFVSATLQHYSLQSKIKIIAAGKIITVFDILKMIALGADAVYAEMDNFDGIKNSLKLPRFRNDQAITDYQGSHIQAIIRIMQTAGFRKIADITMPNLFRNMENFPGFNALIPYQGSVKNIYVSKLNTPAIQ